jgi:signal peptidase I
LGYSACGKRDRTSFNDLAVLRRDFAQRAVSLRSSDIALVEIFQNGHAVRRRKSADFQWQDYVESFLLAIFVALILRTFVITGYRVPTKTMAPALQPGDFIFSWRLPYGVRLPFSEKKWFQGAPKRGEVVVFSFADAPRVNYVKRVLGLPGDLVEIKKGRLQINGQVFDYQMEPTKFEGFQAWRESGLGFSQVILASGQTLKQKDFGPLVIPQNEFFVMGDNRELSDDSRYWGTVAIERIEGRASFIWLSLDWSSTTGWPRLRRERLGNFVN